MDVPAALRADCSRCAGLCCVALPFARSTDFAIDKPAGTPCLHLRDDSRCRIHATLRADGFPGCAAFDCFGAGQRATELAGSWRDADPRHVFAAFEVLRGLHELLWYLDDVRARVHDPSDVVAAIDRIETLAGAPAEQLSAVDVAGERSGVASVLRAAGAEVRRGDSRRFGPRADLAGRDLRGHDLSDEDLRGACLIAADLTNATLRRTDLLGADLRDADLSGADLRDALYLTAAQVGAARGTAATRLPPRLDRPVHWSEPSSSSRHR